MKRETTPRNLHMGCGESLVARVPLSTWLTAKTSAETVKKPVKPKKGEGRQ